MLEAYMEVDASQTVNIENVGCYLLNFEVKLSNQMKNKTNKKMKGKLMERQIKDDVNLTSINEN